MNAQQRIIVALTALSLLMGCAANPYMSTGAALGGGIGSISGAVIDRHNPWRGAAIGGLAGGVLGGVAGEAARQQQVQQQGYYQPNYGPPGSSSVPADPNYRYGPPPPQSGYGDNAPPPQGYYYSQGPPPSGCRQIPTVQAPYYY